MLENDCHHAPSKQLIRIGKKANGVKTCYKWAARETPVANRISGLSYGDPLPL